MVAGGIERLQVAPADVGESARNRPGWRCSSQATTTAISAMPPSATGHFAPLRRPPTTRAWIADGFGIAVALRQRQAADQRAVRQLRQVFPPLRIRSGGQDRLGGQIRGRPERHRRDRSAHFLGQHAQAFVAQAGAAEFFRDRGADPAHLGDLAPQVGGIRLLPVQRAPHHRGCALFRQEPPGLVAQLLEIVRKVEVHGLSPFAHVASRNARCEVGLVLTGNRAIL